MIRRVIRKICNVKGLKPTLAPININEYINQFKKLKFWQTKYDIKIEIKTTDIFEDELFYNSKDQELYYRKNNEIINVDFSNINDLKHVILCMIENDINSLKNK